MKSQKSREIAVFRTAKSIAVRQNVDLTKFLGQQRKFLSIFLFSKLNGNVYCPHKSIKIQNQLGAEKSGSENLPSLAENCRL